jgi:hypothetical protein
MSYPQVNNVPSIDLTGQERVLLQQVYLDYDQILVEKEFSGGHSGTRVLLILPIKSSGRAAARKVTKLGPALELRREQDNYEQYVKDSLPFCTAQVKEYHEQGGRGALNYVFVGDGALGNVIELEECFRRRTVERIQETFDVILNRELGQRWYKDTTPLHCFFAAEYGRHLVEHLRLKLRPGSDDALWLVAQAPVEVLAYQQVQADKIVREHEKIQAGAELSIEGLVVKRIKRNEVKLEDPGSQGTSVYVEFTESNVIQGLELDVQVGVRGEVIHNRHSRMEQVVRSAFPTLLGRVNGEHIELPDVSGAFLNPLSVYPKVLAKTLEGKRSYVHGDLHLRNVLVDEGGRGWLIDFARVEERHNLFDFIKLETYVRLMGLAGDEITFSHGEYVQFEKALIKATLEKESDVTCPDNPQLAFAYRVILAIRQIARNYMVQEPSAFLNEYFPALFLYCLAMTKYYQKARPHPTQLIFIAACVLSHRLFGTGDEPDPEPSNEEKEPDPMRNITYLRKCLVESFANAGEIYNLCQDYLDENEILPQLPANAGIADLVRTIIEYCKAHEQLDILYDFLANKRPGKYKRYYQNHREKFDDKNRLA